MTIQSSESMAASGGAIERLRAFLDERFELERGRADNLPSMEGLRGYAVLLVFLVHYAALSAPWCEAGSVTAAISQFFHQAGSIGVDLFFVLSGYLIYGTLLRRPMPFLKFMRRRVRRLYPAFLCVFALYLVLSWIFPHESKIPAGFSPALGYIAANLLMLPGMLPIEPVITVAWSLSYEIFYYLAVPVLLTVLRLRAWSPRARIALFVLLAIALVAAIPLVGGRARLAMFLSGILLFEAVDRGARLLRPTVAGIVAFALSLLVMAPMLDAYLDLASRIGLLFVAFYVLCLACFTAPDGAVARVFSWTPLRWLGNMSYSYYLIHGVTLKALFLVLSRLLPGQGDQDALLWLLLAPAFAATLIVSAALFLAVERPYSLRVQHRSATPHTPLPDATP